MKPGEKRQGTRVPDDAKEGHLLVEGEYMWTTDDPRGRRLYIHPPGGHFGAISPDIHKITEHEDGTVTVQPSILEQRGNGIQGWHGYLERGVWRRV